MSRSAAQLIGKGGIGNIFEAALLLAADGAHSLVRETLGIDFSGHNFPEAWPLYDIELADPLPLDHAHVSFVENGLIFCHGIIRGHHSVGRMSLSCPLPAPNQRRAAIRSSTRLET
jgi:2-polyprenyl-6-methoxyphenol hydroxylase-like FAD-dependent oxidoreductase